MKLLKSMEELLYEVMTWLVFYPRTLWLSVRHPLRMMDYSDNELKQRVDHQYTDTVSPPLFLILSLLVGHALELAVSGQSEMVRNTQGLDALISSDTNLIALRAISYALFPLILTIRFLRITGQRLDRETMRPAFYSQCYLTAPYALLFGGLTLVSARAPTWMHMAALAAGLTALVAYQVIQTLWFRMHGKLSWASAFGNALRAYLESLILLTVIGFCFA